MKIATFLIGMFTVISIVSDEQLRFDEKLGKTILIGIVAGGIMFLIGC